MHLIVHAIINDTTTLELLTFKGLDIRQLITTAKEWKQLGCASWTVQAVRNNTTAVMDCPHHYKQHNT